MTKNQLIGKCNDMHKSLIKDIFEYVNEKKDKTVHLDNTPYQYVDIELLSTIVYKRIYVEDNILMIEYDFGIGLEPYEYENISEEFSNYDLEEIVRIINRIK